MEPKRLIAKESKELKITDEIIDFKEIYKKIKDSENQ